MCGRPSPRTLARQAERQIGRRYRSACGRFGLGVRVEKFNGDWRAVVHVGTPVLFRGSIFPLGGIEVYDHVLVELGPEASPSRIRSLLARPGVTPLSDYDDAARRRAEQHEKRREEIGDEFEEEAMHLAKREDTFYQGRAP